MLITCDRGIRWGVVYEQLQPATGCSTGASWYSIKITDITHNQQNTDAQIGRVNWTIFLCAGMSPRSTSATQLSI